MKADATCPDCGAPLEKEQSRCASCGRVFRLEAGPSRRGDSDRENKRKQTIDRLAEKMAKRNDFPISPGRVEELTRLAQLATTSASKLTDAILKDPGLTAKVLRLVNSPFSRLTREPITTVSRAVVLLGFETVRQAAMGLVVMDSLGDDGQGHEQATRFREATLESVVSSVIARSLCQDCPEISGEEAVIAAMFRSLGRAAAEFYFSEEMEQARRLALREDIEQDEAVERVLGISLSGLGRELGSRWNFPERILAHMTYDGQSAVFREEGDERIAAVCGLAGDLARVAASTPSENLRRELSRVQQRYAHRIAFSSDDLNRALKDVSKVAREYVFGGQSSASSRLMHNLNAAAGQPPQAGTGNTMAEAFRSALGDAVEHVSASWDLMTVEDAEDLVIETVCLSKFPDETLLQEGAKEIDQTVKATNFDVNEAMMLALETLYRGLGFDRVLFCVHHVKLKLVQAKHGIGHGAAELARTFEFPLEPARDVFNTAMRTGVAVCVANDDGPGSGRIPLWYKQRIDAPLFALYPIAVRGFPAALIYGDASNRILEPEVYVSGHVENLRRAAMRALSRHDKQSGRK